eukprot:jgi/Ulvmu1/7683/UM038_0115.1
MQQQRARPAATLVAACAFCTAARARRIASVDPLPVASDQAADSVSGDAAPAEAVNSDSEEGVDTKTMVLAIIAAVLIALLVIYGFYKMCRSGSAAERAVQLFKFDKSGRGNSERGAYMRHSDDGVLPTATAKQPSKQGSRGATGGLRTIPSGSTL